MKERDERIEAEVRRVEARAFTILRWGVFAVLLVRWFALGQSLADTWDFFAVWVLASMFEFFLLAIRGVPMTYPTLLSNSEQLLFLATVPLFTALLPVLILHLQGALTGWGDALGVFGRTYLVVLALWGLYRAILSRWEKRSLQ